MKSFNKFLSGNDHPPTDPDTKGDEDATHFTQLPTRPSLLEPLPTDHSIGSYQEFIVSLAGFSGFLYYSK